MTNMKLTTMMSNERQDISIHLHSDQGWVFPVQNLFFPSKMG